MNQAKRFTKKRGGRRLETPLLILIVQAIMLAATIQAQQKSFTLFGEVNLKREIEFLECYPDIEKVRFGRRLATNIEIAPEVLLCRVPNLILQPLVENAIRHGLAKQTANGKINISAARENGWLKIAVADNGKGIEDEKLDKVLSSGLGLSNTKARLEQLYGANFQFQLQNATEGGLLVTLRLPHNQKRNKEIFN